MFMNQVPNNAELPAIIINELRDIYGIKYRKDKKTKNTQLIGMHKIFNVPLKELELSEVKLSNGTLCQVPAFVLDACARIMENVEVEGLFRKAGSSARQKEIREKLESGTPLNDSYNVIDVANILKYFFRELPDPLLPPGNFQESILRCLLCKGTNERKIAAIKMVCLLLPQIKLNTLVYFMQFLNVVSMHSSANKMSAKNLAIIFAPSLMPITENIGQRLVSHVQIVEILIEHAHEIGLVPTKLLSRIPNVVLPETTMSDPLNFTMFSGVSSRQSIEASQVKVPETDIKKKKKRRSGSLTRMFNGIRKIVGAIGSAENLDETHETLIPTTPCLTKSKKRKVLESSAFSSKKKKDVLALLPSGSIFPSTPMCSNKSSKKSRLSLGGKRYTKNAPPQANQSNVSKSSVVSSLERRWSFMSSNRNQTTEKSQSQNRVQDPTISSIAETTATKQPESWETQMTKNEYEEIKERVTAIETRISKEFTKLHSSMLNNSKDSVDTCDLRSGPERVLAKFERTLEQTEIMNATPMTEHLAKHLSRGLKIRSSAENKVFRSPSARKIGNIRRRSQENVRLSRNKSWHLGPNKLTPEMVRRARITRNSPLQPSAIVNNPNSDTHVHIPRVNLKRGRPNTFQSGLRSKQPSPTNKTIAEESKKFTITNFRGGDGDVQQQQHQQQLKNEENIELQLQNENWICGDVFFDNFTTPTTLNDDESVFNTSKNNSAKSAKKSKPIRKRLNMNDTSMETQCNFTPCSLNNISTVEKTPMLPPRLPIVKRTPAIRTPHPGLSSVANLNRNHLTPLWQQEQQQNGGRASIARLRSQNAGMVMAKAKLFDELVIEQPNIRNPKQLPKQESQTTTAHFAPNTNAKAHENKHEIETTLRARLGHVTRKANDSPRRKNQLDKTGSNGVQRRHRLRTQRHTPIKKTPTTIDTSILTLSDSNNALQSPMTRRMVSINASTTTPHAKRITTMNKPPRRIIRTPQNKRKPV